MSQKVIILGLDGATWDLLSPWIEEGKLPFFKKIIKLASYGDLETVIPTKTTVAWTSFQTATNPGKHGIFDFLQMKNKQLQEEFITSKDIQSLSFWNYMSRFGKKSCVVGLPVSYPLPKVDGIFVAGLMTPPNVVYAVPDDIYQKLEKIHFKVEMELEKFGQDMPDNYSKTLMKKNIYEITKKRIEALYILLNEEKRWELFFMLFREVDLMQHFFWGKKELFEFWKFLDKELENIYKALQLKFKEEFVFCILSDHGFHDSPRYQFSIFEWLRQEKFISVGKESFTNKLMRIGQNVYWWLQTKNIELTRISIFKNLSLKVVNKEKSTQMIDIFLYGLTINKDLLPKSEKYNSFRDRLIEGLKKIKHNNEYIFLQIGKREDFYSGSNLKNAPDIIFLLNSNYKITSSPFASELIHERPAKDITNSGDHSAAIKGMFLIVGSQFKKNFSTKAKICDMIPTLLHILGVRMDDQIDGRILKEMFIKQGVINYQNKRNYISDLIGQSFQK